MLQKLRFCKRLILDPKRLAQKDGGLQCAMELLVIVEIIISNNKNKINVKILLDCPKILMYSQTPQISDRTSLQLEIPIGPNWRQSVNRVFER